ncbi:hypothetical protein AB0I66_21475 [Streptomyces sp. NPDC050439]|uniref:hypothetical protein n=1 Tax=unclassified Streptomyces TaxID=2593676 RepID=UPI0034365520
MIHTECLTPLDRQIIAGLARGHGAARIAADLRLPDARNVHQHIAAACTRIGLHRQSQTLLVNYAYKHGYMEGLTPETIQRTGRLTPRRHETLIALARGDTLPYNRREQLRRHLGAKTCPHAVALGWQLGLLGPGSGAAP